MGHQKKRLYFHIQGSHKLRQLFTIQSRWTMDCVSRRGWVIKGMITPSMVLENDIHHFQGTTPLLLLCTFVDANWDVI